VIGRSIRIAGLYCTIVGVMPNTVRGFTSPTNSAVDIWAPMMGVRSVVAPGGKAVWGQVFGHLADGASFRQAEAELQVAGAHFDPDVVDLGATARRVEQGVAPARARLAIGAMSTALVALSALVLMIACANLGNLLLARSASRSAEFAIRTALGASPAQILRLQLLETTTLAAMGAAVGAALVTGLSRTIGRFTLYTDGGSVMTGTLLVNGWVIAYFFLVMAATAVAIGIAPAMRAIRLEPARVLASSGSRGMSHRFERKRTVLVASQVAGSTVLLIVAALFLQSAFRASRYGATFDTQHVVMGSFDFGSAGWDERRGRTEQEALLTAARSRPETRNAALSTGLPASGDGEMVSIEPADRVFSDREYGPPCRCLSVSPGFLNVLGLSPLRGRDFDAADQDASRGTAIVNETAASQLWPGTDPIERRLRIRKGEALTVVGMVGDTDRTTQDVSDRCTIFVPIAQRYSPHFFLVAAGTSSATLLLKPLEAAMADVLPKAPMFDVKTAQAHLTRAAGVLRSAAAALVVLGGIALTIAVVGLYGVTAYVVGLRRAEFGIRKALGATNARIHRLVLAEASRMVGIGLAAGVPIALVVSLLVTHALVGVTSHDVATYLIVPVGLLFVTVVVTWYPAWRAAREEPSVTLRNL
jgi:predicted permease